MSRVHTKANIRAVCQHLLDTEGERALTRAAVQAALKARAVELGLEPVAADHKAVSECIATMKDELRAARDNARAGAGTDELPLPAGLESALERHAREVEGLCRRALRESARQTEIGVQARLQQIEAERAEQLALLRADLYTSQQDAAIQAGQLDEAESALAAARASLAAVSAALEERTVALATLEGDTRGQLSAAQDRLQEATTARIASDDRAHASELAEAKTRSELAVALERTARLEAALTDASEVAKNDEVKLREAERTSAVAQGQLTALKDDCEWLRLQLARRSDTRRASERGSARTSSANEKTKSAGGR